MLKKSYQPNLNRLTPTEFPRCLKIAFALETGLSDFHLMILRFLRKRFKNVEQMVIHYKSYKYIFFNEYSKNIFLISF